MNDATIELRESSVRLGDTFYFSAKACRDAIAAEAERLTWFPLVIANEMASSVPREPGVGGC